MKGKYTKLSLDRILDPEKPIREDLSQESVKDLTASIKGIGIINPLIVKKSGDKYELVAGHRRLVAAQIAGLTEAPCLVVEASGIDVEVIKLQENLIRENINPIDWANHIAHLKEQYKLQNAKIADLLGMSEAWVSQHLLILEYPASLLDALKADRLSFSAARELAQIRDPKKRDLYINHAVRGGITPALATRWKKEANREPIDQTPQHPRPEETPPQSPIPASPSPCIICGEAIKPEEAVTLTVHLKCQPQELPPAPTPPPDSVKAEDKSAPPNPPSA